MSCYQKSQRRFDGLKHPSYHRDDVVRTLDRRGTMVWDEQRIPIAKRLGYQRIRLTHVSEGCWDVAFGPVALGTFDEGDMTGSCVLG